MSARIRNGPKLTPREHQLLCMIWNGLTNKEIAYEWEISVRTVEQHRNNLLGKMQATNVAQVIRTGLLTGLIS